MLNPNEFLGLGGLDEQIWEQIAAVHELKPRSARFAQPKTKLHPKVVSSLERQGVTQFYTHQAASIDAFAAGADFVVTAGTSAGKSLCYFAPIMQMACSEPASRALLIYPTKALAQDQLGKLKGLGQELSIYPATYDGDTPRSQRASIRKISQAVLTNPDMLHLGMLPAPDLWSRFFKSLRLIVLDEMHMYRGVFGSHVALILRRLLRLCAWHHNRPQIVACTATIKNPEETFRALTGRTPLVIDDDGGPQGKKTFAFWNPPLVDVKTRISPNVAAGAMLAHFAESNVQSLVFSRARVSAELVLRYARKALEGSEIDPSVVESYRAGYTAAERRKIEQALFKGKLRGLSSTNALELGVDIGNLDAVVMNGYPGSIASFWQQAGRAGRGGKDGLAVLLAHEDPLEQYLIYNPEGLLGASSESVTLNPENPNILKQQLKCAAHERPISASELMEFTPNALETAESMDREGTLQFQSGLFYYPSVIPPASEVSIRGMGGSTIRLLCENEELGQMDYARALSAAHVGAVYLHRGLSFVVRELNLQEGFAIVVSQEVPFYTQPVVQTVVTMDSVRQQNGSLSIGHCRVTSDVTAYRRRSLDGGEILDTVDLDLPAQTFETVGIRVDLPPLSANDDISEEIAGVHGLEHALLALAPMLCGCDRGDLGSMWTVFNPDTQRPAVFIFDQAPGGVGLVEKLFTQFSTLVSASVQLISRCPCATGCPRCLLSARCESGNEHLSKEQTLQLLRELLEN